MSIETKNATAEKPPAMPPDDAIVAPPLSEPDVIGSIDDAVIADPNDDKIDKRSLKLRALVGTAWTMGDYFVGRGLALACNVVLSYFIAPEAFGLMTTVSVFLMGLQMFSDIGIGPNIIFSKRGDDPQFLNTAWTIQVLRGTALFIMSCVIAWPVATFYQTPQLLYLLPVCGFTSVIQGFTSTSLITLNRKMKLAAFTILDTAGQVLQVLAMVACAYWISRDVWALVIGTYVSSLFRVGYSHMLEREHRNRFAWNKEDAQSMFRFGRWIFVSTVLTFFASQLDRLMFAKRLGMATAGIYGNAVQFAVVPQQLIKKVGSVVLFPVLAEVVRERPHELPSRFERARRPLIAVSLFAIVTLILIAKPLINLLYDDQYQKAGPMLQILCVGVMGGLLNSTYGSALLALGKTFIIMLLLAVQIGILIVSTSIGYRMHGEIGFIWGVALVEWLNFPLTAYMMSRFGLFQPKVDILAILISATAIVLAFFVFP